MQQAQGTHGTEHTVASATTVWWRSGYVWLVIAGPALVIVAGIITIYLAVARPDPVINTAPAQATRELATAPALQARNHAATGALPSPPPAEKTPDR